MTQLMSTVGAATRGQARQVEMTGAPAWYSPDSVGMLHRALAKAASTEEEIVLPRSEHCELKNFEAFVTERGEKDLLVQFLAPRCKEFADVLPEIVEAHFGTTDGFKLHIAPEIKTFGLLMEGIRGRPTYTYAHAATDFLTVVDDTLSILREA